MFDPIIIVLFFAAAWLLTCTAAIVALKVLAWNDRRSAEWWPSVSRALYSLRLSPRR